MDRDVDTEHQEGAPVPGEGEVGGDGPIYQPAPGERQLTVRAVVAGCLLGGLVTAMNIYFGLRTGWGVGGSLIAAILAYAAFRVIGPREAFTPLETNIAQTAGSAAGSMTMAAGLVAAIPALALLGTELSYLELTLWAASVAWLGVFYAVPLRRQMVLVEKLRFPTGTATAHTIVAMFGSGAETVRKARTLLLWALVAGVFTLAAFFVPQMEQPPLHAWITWAPLATAAAYTFTVYLSPLLIGAGVLVGMRVSLSLVAGAVVAWALLAPFVEAQGWVSGPTMSYGSGAGSSGPASRSWSPTRWPISPSRGAASSAPSAGPRAATVHSRTPGSASPTPGGSAGSSSRRCSRSSRRRSSSTCRPCSPSSPCCSRRSLPPSPRDPRARPTSTP
jgi:uncharacterized oligopeptide transporter (OPT) family protein